MTDMENETYTIQKEDGSYESLDYEKSRDLLELLENTPELVTGIKCVDLHEENSCILFIKEDNKWKKYVGYGVY